jgi:hypothetical protein
LTACGACTVANANQKKVVNVSDRSKSNMCDWGENVLGSFFHKASKERSCDPQTTVENVADGGTIM